MVSFLDVSMVTHFLDRFRRQGAMMHIIRMMMPTAKPTAIPIWVLSTAIFDTTEPLQSFCRLIDGGFFQCMV